jgi:hypothetical protein
MLAEYRAVLTDIAAETASRRQRTINIDYTKLTDKQLDRIHDGEDEIRVI